jgi:hypothetical protein
MQPIVELGFELLLDVDISVSLNYRVIDHNTLNNCIMGELI